MDAGGVGVTASSVRSLTVVDWSTVVSVLPPPAQALTGVSPCSCLYTFGLQRAPQSDTDTDTSHYRKSYHVTHVHTAAASHRWSTGVRLHTGDPVALVTRFTHTPTHMHTDSLSSCLWSDHSFKIKA